ncbi:S8 family serine peptidase [Paenibacillus tarimensis]|uniref:S8 family serine peptidase n=1 Tax=Paenibacillus tarimensis TaxID=416012 RepID=UPI0039EE1D48
MELTEPVLLSSAKNDEAIAGQWLVSYHAPPGIQASEEGFRSMASVPAHIELIEVQPGEEARMAEELENNPSVAYVEPNYQYRAAADITSVSDQDPLIDDQWGLRAVQAQEAWDQMKPINVHETEPVIVAVLDSGIETTHPDLQGRFLPGYNAIEDSNNIEDDFGHGTAVSGIINAVYSNNLGIAGIAGRYPVQVLPIKVLDETGSGSTYTVIKGIEKAVESGADVINLSFSGSGNSYLLQETIRQAVGRGIVVVAAAGNHADHTSGYYPAMYPETIAVSAINEAGEFASFSNYGTPIDIAAPGERILTTTLEGNYEYHDGTSLAAPYVAGAAALLKLTRPEWSGQEIRSALEHSAKDLGSEGFDVYFGHGLLQIQSALSPTGKPGRTSGLQLLKPNRLEQVKGKVDVEVRLPEGISHLSIIDAQGLPVTPDNLQVRIPGGIAAFSLNTEHLADGIHAWTIQAFSDTGEPVGESLELRLLVSNTIPSGVPVTVLDTNQKPVHGAIVHLMRLSKEITAEEPFDTIFRAYTNDQGLAFFPRPLLLSNENYMVKVSFTDDRTGLEYTAVQEIGVEKPSLLLDFHRQYEVDFATTGKLPSSVQPAEAQVLYTVVPTVHHQELWDMAVRLEPAMETNKVNTVLPAGTYSAYAVYHSPEGSYIGKRELDLRAENMEDQPKEIQFVLDHALNMAYSLPGWSHKANLYLEPGISGLEDPLALQEGKPLWLDSYSTAPHTIELIQLAEESEWEYLLSSKEPLLQAGVDPLNLPEHAVLAREGGSTKTSRLTLRPGETIDTKYSLTLGDSLSIDQILKDGEPVNPAAVLVDRKGREISRTDIYDSSWTVPDHIPKGNYSLFVDASGLPLPFSGSSRVKLYDVRIKDGMDTTVTIISHDSQYSLLCELIVADPKTGKELFSEMMFYEKEASFEVPGLSPNSSYLLKIRGLTSDQTPFYTEMMVKAGTEDSLSIDLASEQSGLRLVSYALQAGQFFDLSKNGVNVASTSAEQDHTFSAWVGKGSYTMTLVQKNSEKPYYFKRDISINQNTTELNTDPDYSSMLMVGWQSPFRNADDQIGIKDKQNPVLSDHILFPLNQEQQLYVSPGDYDFELLDIESAGQVKIAHVLQAKPKLSGRKMIFQSDQRYTACLCTQGSSLQEVRGAVKVTDRFGNRLINLVQLTYEDWNAIRSTAMPTVDPLDRSKGQSAEDPQMAAFRKIGEQSIHPTLRLWHQDQLVAEQQGTWGEFVLKLPKGLKKGKYTLVWEVQEAVSLTAERKIRLNGH